MKNLKFMFFLTVSFLVSDCTSDNIVNPIDSELQKNIIGTWKDNSNYTITFFYDGSFVDSIYFLNNPDTSNNSFGLFIRKGNYSISNSVLVLSDFYFDSIITNANIGMAFSSHSTEISINNNILKRIPFILFDNVGNNRKNIWDKWETKGWWCQADANDSSTNYFGSYKERYTFIEDSTEYFYTRSTRYALNDSTYEYSSRRRFTYNPPYLDLPANSEYNIDVQFKINKMYWYKDYMLNDLLKVR